MGERLRWKDREGCAPCSSMPSSTASSSSDSEGYLNVLRRRCAATVSAPRSLSISTIRSGLMEKTMRCKQLTLKLWIPSTVQGVEMWLLRAFARQPVLGLFGPRRSCG